MIIYESLSDAEEEMSLSPYTNVKAVKYKNGYILKPKRVKNPIKVKNFDELLALNIKIPTNGGYLAIRKAFEYKGEVSSAFVVLENPLKIETYCYLSTHTFYKKFAKHMTEELQKYGFNVELIPEED